MKKPIEWHEECLVIRHHALHRLERKTIDARRREERYRQECEFYAKQIIEAKKQGKDGFDRKRFMVKRVRPDRVD